MQFKQVDVDSLKAYPQNARTHNEKQVAQIAESIKEFGFLAPCLVDKDNVLIVGHGRLMAAKTLGMKKVPTLRIEHLTPNQVKAYRIADNQLALNAGWDMDLLGLDLTELSDAEFNIDLLGFDAKDLDALIGNKEGLTDPDEVPEEPETPVSKEGDLWLLGNHRLLCGDSTSIDAVDVLMAGQKADMVFTDPPYNADYKSRGKNKRLQKGIKNDALSDEMFDQFIDQFLPLIFTASKNGASFYICCNWKDSYPKFYQKIVNAEKNVSCCIVWDKGSGGMGWQDYRYQYELIIYGFQRGKGHTWYGGRKETDIWKCSREKRTEYVHPTQKPTELIQRAIKNSSKAGDTVLDLFGGSGSTLVAAHSVERIAYCMELDPVYVDVAVARWENFTGKDAKLETGETFKEKRDAQAH